MKTCYRYNFNYELVSVIEESDLKLTLFKLLPVIYKTE